MESILRAGHGAGRCSQTVLLNLPRHPYEVGGVLLFTEEETDVPSGPEFARFV